ncbi:hypothetical protein C9374_001782 [Naegleria lovaniensis]|uniref:DUF4116 domain-containing protein n=1 Tax=Naegleria lovaniensis TaxID=51637 RepID=A0AA88GV23_NAELO|nr:uncharacterized protein C9374_001782 [Naegleria lovaniensis]KAG2387450.1 hypothetical protein C9374_001782 [Naegleria lovaniensis]
MSMSDECHETEERLLVKELMSQLNKKFFLQQRGKKKFLEHYELVTQPSRHCFIPIEFTKDKSYVLNVIQQNRENCEMSFLRNAILTFPRDRQVVLEIVKRKGYLLEYACEELRNDKDLVMEALKQNGCAYKFVSESLKNEKEIVLTSVKQIEHSEGHLLSREWKIDNDVFLCSICPNRAHNYSHTNWNLDCIMLYSTLSSDKEFYLDTVHRHPSALEFASEDLKNDKEFILSCVALNGKALQFASPSLRNDKQVVFEALKQNRFSLSFASNEIKSDKAFMMKAILENHHVRTSASQALQFASQELWNEQDLIFSANPSHVLTAFMYWEIENSRQKPQAQVALSIRELYMNKLKQDRNFLLHAVALDGTMLKHGSDDLKNDKDIVFEAINNTEDALRYASDSLKHDKEFMLKIVQQKPRVFTLFETRNYFAPFLQDRDFVLRLIRQHLTCVLFYISPQLRLDRELVLEAVRQIDFAWDCIAFVSDVMVRKKDEIFHDPEIEMECVKHTGYARTFSMELYQARMDHYYYGAYLGNKVHYSE